MIPQRDPALRVAPVEVGDPIEWAPAITRARDLVGTSHAHRGRYLVGPMDDVYVAGMVTRRLGHAGERDHYTTLRHCQTLEAAQQACQDEEHRRAWSTMTCTARELLRQAFAA